MLTKQPGAGESVKVIVRSEPTRTDKTGGIRSFIEQVALCAGDALATGSTVCQTDTDFRSGGAPQLVLTLTFTASNWDHPQTVTVRAIDDHRVDGQDRQVFAPTLNYLNNIQGPLFVRGGLGDDRTGLFELEPVMLPAGYLGRLERNEKPSMGNVTAPPAPSAASADPATVTIDPTGLHQATVNAADGDPGDNSIQEVTVVATSGTFTLEYDANGDGSIDASTERTGALAFNATVLQVQTALEGIVGADNVTVSANSNVYKVRFATSALAPGNPLMVANSTNLGPSLSNPSALVNFTLEITKGAAKNKVRIIKGVVANDATHWVLTLDHPWNSPFALGPLGPDSEVPSPAGANRSKYALEITNPNLLVNEVTSTDMLLLHDTDNPASYNDPAPELGGASNPFGEGRLFFENQNIYGSFVPDAAATPIPPLNLFRITGFGMGADREIGEVPTVKGGTTLRTVIQPGGITFKDIEDLQISLGPGNNKFTVDDSPLGTLTRLNNRVRARARTSTPPHLHTPLPCCPATPTSSTPSPFC